MIRILFVCLGNICRSPLAEAIFNHKITKYSLKSKISSDSAGTANYHVGDSPDPRTIEVANNHNIPINHLGKQFNFKHEKEFDYLVAMDQSNRMNMIGEIGNDEGSIFLMRDFDPQGKGKDVPDPWYGGMQGFEDVYEILDRSTENFLKFIREKHNL